MLKVTLSPERYCRYRIVTTWRTSRDATTADNARCASHRQRAMFKPSALSTHAARHDA
jgi:hypothetical protein